MTQRAAVRSLGRSQRRRSSPPVPLLHFLVAAILTSSSARECPLSVRELADGATFLTNILESSPNSNLVNCTWYRKDTCCSAEDTLRISHADPEISLHGTSRGCRDALHLLMCAPCSPEQSSLFAQRTIAGFPVSVLRTCERFCTRLLKACGAATISLAEGRRDRVDATFGTGRAFCRAVGLRVVGSEVALTDEDTQCFSAAGPRRGDAGRASFSALVALVASLATASTTIASSSRRRREALARCMSSVKVGVIVARVHLSDTTDTPA